MNQNRKQTYDSEKYILIYFPNHLLLYSLSYMSWYGVHTMHDTASSLYWFSSVPFLVRSLSCCFCSSANLVPSFRWNTRRHLAWNSPGMGVPSRFSSLYELCNRLVILHGIDHLGSNILLASSELCTAL